MKKSYRWGIVYMKRNDKTNSYFLSRKIKKEAPFSGARLRFGKRLRKDDNRIYFRKREKFVRHASVYSKFRFWSNR